MLLGTLGASLLGDNRKRNCKSWFWKSGRNRNIKSWLWK